MWEGQQEIQLCFYRPECFPLQCIGPVKMFICPDIRQNECARPRKMWLWVHAACLEELLGALNTQLTNQSALYTTVSLDLLRDNVCRFSLIGALSSVVLSRVLLASPPPGRAYASSPTFAPLEHSEFARLALQSGALNSLWLHGRVLGVQAPDCRELTFSQRGEATFRQIDAYSKWGHTTDASVTRIDERQVRRRLKWPVTAAECYGLFDNSLLSSCEQSMTPTDLVHKQRSEQRKKAYTLPHFFRSLEKGDNWTVSTGDSQKTIQPGGGDMRTSGGACVDGLNSFPVLMVRQSNYQSFDCGSSGKFPPSCKTKSSGGSDLLLPLEQTGWDIIVPSVWARPLWVALNYAGACAVGLTEMEAIHTAAGSASFPRDYPDSRAGRDYWGNRKAEETQLLQRRPHRKKKIGRRGRVPEWDDLFGQAAAKSREFGVIRNPQQLMSCIPTEMTSSKCMQRQSRLFTEQRDTVSVATSLSSPLSMHMAVRVFLRCTGRGSPESGAVICSPLSGDREKWTTHHRTRRTHTLSKGRRLGEWWGECAGSEEGRKAVGIVAAGCRADLSGSPVVAVGFCEATALKEMLAAGFRQSTGPVSTLVMFRNPLSEWYRPALLEAHGF